MGGAGRVGKGRQAAGGGREVRCLVADEKETGTSTGSSVALNTAIAQFGAAIGPAALLYLPAIKRLAMSELIALWQLLQAKNQDAAYQAVAAKMTVQELADEKEKLADLAALRATARAENIALANEIAAAVLKAAITILITAVLL